MFLSLEVVFKISVSSIGIFWIGLAVVLKKDLITVIFMMGLSSTVIFNIGLLLKALHVIGLSLAVVLTVGSLANQSKK